MSETTISTYTTVAITVGNSSVTITNSGEINTKSAAAIYGTTLQTAEIFNYGTLEATHYSSISQQGGCAIRIDEGTISNGSDRDEAALLFGNEFGVSIRSDGLINNFGTIASLDYGVFAYHNADIVNGSDKDNRAIISSPQDAAEIFDIGQVTNFGTVLSSHGVGVLIEGNASQSSTLQNGSSMDRSAMIKGYITGAILGLGNEGMFSNFGTILCNRTYGGSNYGVFVQDGGTLFNAGLIEGYSGISIFGSNVTLTNAGTIVGNGRRGVAVEAQRGFQRLIIDPGAVFIGQVEGAGVTAMELASSSSAGTVTGIGTQFTGFSSITIDTHADWLISGNSAGLAAGEIISGFGAHDTIVLDGFSISSAAYEKDVGLVLNVGTASATLHLAGGLDGKLVVTNAVEGVVVQGAMGHVALGAGEFEILSSGGSSSETTINAGGEELVYGGGTARNTTIAGGILRIKNGGHAAGEISFSGTNGELIIGARHMLRVEIEGFVAGDKIKLGNVPYVAGAKASVETAGTVNIDDGGAIYQLHIAGATVGEHFAFGPGSVLRVGAGPEMAFLRATMVKEPDHFVAAAVVHPAVAHGIASAVVPPVGGVARDWLGLQRAGGDSALVTLHSGF